MKDIEVEEWLKRHFPFTKLFGKLWDPWPVKGFRPDATYRQARLIVHHRNCSSIGAFFNYIDLLPASASTDKGMTHQGGSATMALYSIRSPTRSPLRFHLWMTPSQKVMVHYKCHSMTLIRFLEVFEASGAPFSVGSNVWQQLREEDTKLFPANLREEAHKCWQNFNTFPKLMDLPPELYERIIQFVLGPPLTVRPKTYRQAHGVVSTCMRLLLTNKTFCRLTAFLVYSQDKFYFGRIKNYDWFIRNISDASCKTLQSVEICMHHSALSTFFGLSLTVDAEGHPKPTRMTRPRIEHLTNLRHLGIELKIGSTSWCNKVYNLWIWAAARPHLYKIPKVQFLRHFPKDQTVLFLEDLEKDRKSTKGGVQLDPQDMIAWQEDIWSIP